MPIKALLKTSVKNSTLSKSYQLRLTVTPKLHADIVKARKKYKYLDDIEIVKIFIGHGVDKEFLITDEADEDEISFDKAGQLAFLQSESNETDEDFASMYNKTTGRKLVWK
jgi:hypothetical protein